METIDRPLVHLAPADIHVGRRFRTDLGDLAPLSASIGALGLLQPLVLDANHNLVSGQRRLQACQLLGMSQVPCVIAHDLTDAVDLLHAERDENTCRKQFTPEEAVLAGERIETLVRPQAEARRLAGVNGDTGGRGRRKTVGENCPNVSPRAESARTAAAAASAVGMSRRTYEKTKAVVASGNRTIIDTMNRTGNVDRAFKALKRARQREHVQRLATTIEFDSGIWLGDFREVGGSIAESSVDLVFADPPYSRKDVGLYGDLSQFSARVLRPGGWLLAYCGLYHLPRALREIEDGGLTYLWINCVKHSGGEPFIPPYNLQNAWKPILMFYKPPLAVTWDSIRDTVSGGREKDRHPWQQAEAEANYYIDKITVPGSVVCDPCAGAGTTLAAAQSLGRRWVGIEIDARHVATARERLAKATVAGAT